MTILALRSAIAPFPDLPAAPDLLAALRAREPVLTGAGLLLLAMTLPTAVALLVETRTLNGINVWVKPLKFQASVGLYLLTLAWFWGYVAEATRRRIWLRATAWATAATGLGEILYITLQAGRGARSHFNDATVWEQVAYAMMGVGSLVLTGASLALGVAIWRRGIALPPAFRLSVVLGLVLTFLLGTGTGIVTSVNGGHWVGGMLTDAGGLPVFGWSRSGGDLRVAHFFGMHAMHVLPVLGWVAARATDGPNAGRIVWSASAVYAALTLAVLAQALAGRPFLPVLG